MVERSVYILLDFTWLKDLCIVYWTSHGIWFTRHHMVERSVYSLLDFTWLKDLCIVYWTSHG